MSESAFSRISDTLNLLDQIEKQVSSHEKQKDAYYLSRFGTPKIRLNDLIRTQMTA